MNANDQPPFMDGAASSDKPGGEDARTPKPTTRNGEPSCADLHESPSSSTPTVESWRECTDEHYVVRRNGQQFFGWVNLVDVLRSVANEAQAGYSSAAITIIEYHPGRTPPSEDSLLTQFRKIEEQLGAIGERQKRVIEPLAEQNASLRNDEIDSRFVRPLLEAVIQTLDRLDDELIGCCEMDDALRNGRESDREEYLQLLRRFGVRLIRAIRGDPFNPKYHKVSSRRISDSPAKIGRVRHARRPGYIRECDGAVIRGAWVEVYVEANGAARE